jgi:FkbM family methyltransferase
MSNTKEVDWAVTELCANLCNEAYYDKVKMIAYLNENNIKYCEPLLKKYNFYSEIGGSFFPKKKYSLLGEDIFIEKYFKNKSKGFYIDVGCYHPLDGNNTHLLYKKGWNGINLDINYYSIKLFNFLRRRDINIHSGISNKRGRLTMYYRKEINMLNTLDKKIAKMQFRNGYKKKNIQVNTLNYHISKHSKKIETIDFINIDVEGGELNVLKSLNFRVGELNRTLIFSASFRSMSLLSIYLIHSFLAATLP